MEFLLQSGTKNDLFIMRKLVLLLAVFSIAFNLNTQDYDLLLKNGTLIDPKNKIHAKMDIAIKNGKIAGVDKRISSIYSKKTIDIKGLIVCPGLIDIHTHVFVGSDTEKFANGINSISPDDFTLRAGITTVVDAGTSGWKNFPLFKSQVIDKSKTRIFAFLNIAGNGMTGNSLQEDINEMNIDSALACILFNADHIVGVKIGHFEKKDWVPFDRAIDLANKANTPLFVECHLPEYSLEEQLARMRPGDIITHSFEKVKERASIIDDNGKLRPFVLAAKKRGILFDLGHGGAGFWFSEAIPAIKQGLAPNSLGTDMHRFSVNAGMKDMLNVMSKFMALGLSLDDVITRATWFPALSIKRLDLGNLSAGSIADITVLSNRKGKFGFIDAGSNKIYGKSKLEAELTIRNGQVVWDLNGLNTKEYKILK